MSKSSSMRIVLVDTRGDVLFSGASTIAAQEWSTDEMQADACPETKRSLTSDSGIYVSASRRAEIVEDEMATPPDEIRGSKSRAA